MDNTIVENLIFDNSNVGYLYRGIVLEGTFLYSIYRKDLRKKMLNNDKFINA